jgi:rhomboid family protein
MFIVPVSDDDYLGRTPYVVVALAIVNLLMLAATYLLSSSQAVFSKYGFVPADPHFLTAISSMFLHAGILHYVGNMFFLWMFGYRIENTFGSWLFAIVYLVCGLGGTALDYTLDPTSAIPSVGASGAISGIVGCYFVLFPKSRFNIEVYFLRFHVDTIPAHTRGAIGVWIAEQTILGLLSKAARFSSVAFWAHVGGFATGSTVTLALLLLYPKLRIRGSQPYIVQDVKGVVCDGRGKALPNARFELQRAFDDPLIAVTGPSGRFAIETIPDGCYLFTVSKDGWQPFQGNIVVRKRRRYRQQIRVRMKEFASEESTREQRDLVSET